MKEQLPRAFFGQSSPISRRSEDRVSFREYVGRIAAPNRRKLSITKTNDNGKLRTLLDSFENSRRQQIQKYHCMTVSESRAANQRGKTRSEIEFGNSLRKIKNLNITQKLSEILLPEQRSEKTHIVDFGSCQVAEMNAWSTTVEKLSQITNNPVVKRSVSVSETITGNAKDFLSRNIRKRSFYKSKSYEDSSNKTLNISQLDLSLSRENFRNSFLYDTMGDFSSNIWYFGEVSVHFQSDHESKITNELDLELKTQNQSDHESETAGQSDHESETAGQSDHGSKPAGKFDCKQNQIDQIKHTMLVRVDRFGDVVYSLTLDTPTEIYIRSIPFREGRYCLNFTDWMQPRFASAKYLIAYLIENNQLERVTFDWLIEYTLQKSKVTED